MWSRPNKYDDAYWHYRGEFPTELPASAGATHIGMFVAWALLAGLGRELVDLPRARPARRIRASPTSGPAGLWLRRFGIAWRPTDESPFEGIERLRARGRISTRKNPAEADFARLPAQHIYNPSAAD